MNGTPSRIRFGLWMLLVPLLAGCAAAVGAAAGAAGVIAYNERGATTELESDVAQVADATEAVFATRGITMMEREVEDGGAEIEIHGRDGDLQVVVDIEREDNGRTSVEVTAREGMVDYDRDYAEDVLRAIIARS